MAGWMCMLGSLRGVAEAGVIASHLAEAENRSEDLAKVRSFLENKIVVQKLIDYGVSPEIPRFGRVSGAAQEQGGALF